MKFQVEEDNGWKGEAVVIPIVIMDYGATSLNDYNG